MQKEGQLPGAGGHDLEGPAFCEACFSHSELRRVVSIHGRPGEGCLVCGVFGKRSLASSHSLLRQAFRLLIRLHFSEWEYNTHVGGEYLGTVLFGRNAIMDLGPTASEEAFEEALSEVEDGWYDDPSQITLGGDLFTALAHSIEPGVGRIIRQALKGDYDKAVAQAAGVIRDLENDLVRVIPGNRVWHRARIGLEKTWVNLEGRFTPFYSYEGYAGAAIGAPPDGMAGEGRLNRAAESVMYLASDAPTAVAEVRPHPGHLVSTAVFCNERPLRIADLAVHNVLDFATDKRLLELWKILTLGSFITLPVTPDARHLYLATQLIADAVRLAGFDGILFRSSVAEGQNLVGFDPADFRYVAGSNRVVEVQSVTYVTRAVVNLRDGDPPRDDAPAPQFESMPPDAAFFSDLFARRFS